MGFHVLVLAGGSGTRLWPLSREQRPKHLLPLASGGRTLLRATLERVAGLGDSVRVLTAASQAGICADELEAAGLTAEALIAEPVARGTGPALGLAVTSIARHDPEALVASVHADHRVGDAAAYRAAVVASAGWAGATAGLATVGIVPTHAATGFGYIELGQERDVAGWRAPIAGAADEAAVSAAARLPAFTAAGFAEKPSADVALRYVEGGRHLWNLGLFAWPAAFFLEELRRADAALADALDAVVAAMESGDAQRAHDVYAGLRSVAVEPLVLERTARLTVVEARFPWSDLGSWADLRQAAEEEGAADAEGNVLDGDVLSVGSRGCLVEARADRVVAVLGGEELIVVDTPDALLVAPAREAQRVKEVVERLRSQGRSSLL